MKAEPARTFVIEDSVYGVRAAKAAGMRVIGFTGGGHSYPGHADALTEAGAETVIRRWAEFPGTLQALAQLVGGSGGLSRLRHPNVNGLAAAAPRRSRHSTATFLACGCRES